MEPAIHREFKDGVFEQFARITKALASPKRLEILDLLAQVERRVDDLASLSGLTVANTSRHLQVLHAARLVDVRREGSHAYYRLADKRVFRTWQAIRDLGEAQLAELDRIVASFLGDRTGVEAVTADELLERLRQGDVVVLDVRPEEEYRSGHIPGALSVPVARLESVLGELPTGREVIAYCRGPYCMYSDEAVALLRQHGFRARRLAIGMPDWMVAGQLVE